MQIASLKVKINQLREELQESVSKLDLERAQTQKNKLLDLEAQLSQPSPNTTPTDEVTLVWQASVQFFIMSSHPTLAKLQFFI